MECTNPVTLVTVGSPWVRHYSFSGVCPRGTYERSGFARWGAVFDGDVFQFTGFKDGFKDVAAFDAFYKLSVLFPGYDLHTWMLTGFPLGSLGRRRVWNHKSGLNSLSGQEGQLPEIAGILDLPFRLSSPIFPLAGHFILRKGLEPGD